MTSTALFVALTLSAAKPPPPPSAPATSATSPTPAPASTPSPFSDEEDLDDKLFQARRLESSGNTMAVIAGVVTGVGLVACVADVAYYGPSKSTGTSTIIIGSIGLTSVVVGLAIAGVGRIKQRRVLHRMSLRPTGVAFRF